MITLVAAAAGALAGLAAVEVALIAPGRRRIPAGKWRPVAAFLAPARGLAGRTPPDLQALLEGARLARRVDPRSVMGLKVLLAGIAAACSFAAALLSDAPVATLFLLAGPPLVFVLPDLVLRRLVRRNRARVAAEVPDVAARLHLAVAAGLSPVRAMAAAGSPGHGPLSVELAAAASAVETGLPLAGALNRLAARCPDSDVRALAAAIRRSQEQGSDITALLEDLSRASRRRQGLRVRDRARKAGPKIQLVVALLLVPAAMCLIAAALLSGLFAA